MLAVALPAAVLHHVGVGDAGYGEALHGAEAVFRGFGEDGGVVEVGGGADDGLGAGFGFGALGGVDEVAGFDAEEFGIVFGVAAHVELDVAFLHEDAGADEDGLGAELHHEGGVGGGRDAAGGEVGDGEMAGLGDHGDELVGGAEVLGGGVEFWFRRGR